MGKKDILFKLWENWKATCRRMKLDHFLTPYTKINSIRMKDLNIRQETIKTLKENTGHKLFDLGCSNLLIDTSLKARETRTNINYWDFIKIKNVCTAKETINKTKRQPMEWEKLFAINVSDTGLVSKIYKELLKLNTQKTNDPVKKWSEDMNRHFSKEYIQMASKDTQYHLSAGKYKSKSQ